MYKHEQGLSLIELLIASTLSLLLLAIASHFYQKNQETDRYQKGLATIQENGRVAMQILREGIRTAGYVGCGRSPIISPAIRGDEGKIIIRKMNPYTVDLTSSARVGLRQLNVSNTQDFKVGDKIVIADCIRAQIAEISSIKNRQLTLKTAVQYPFSTASEVGRFIESTFYVADSGRKNRQGVSIFSLYRLDSGRARFPAELVDGVEKIQILYGIQSVKITLLINSIEPIAKDRLLKREWSTFITVRI